MPEKADRQALKKLRSDILLAEYKARTDEITHLSSRYTTVMMSAGVLVSAVLVVGGFGFQWVAAGISKIPQQHDVGMRQILAVLLPAFILYLIAAAMDALHLIMVNGLRRAEIEKALNKLAGKEMLIWDQQIMPSLFNTLNCLPKQLWIKPNILVFLLLAISTGTVFMACDRYLGPSFGTGALVYRGCIYAAWVFVFLQWLILITAVAGKIEKLSFRIHTESSGGR